MFDDVIEHDESTITVSKKYIQSLLKNIAENSFYIYKGERISINFSPEHPFAQLCGIFDVDEV